MKPRILDLYLATRSLAIYAACLASFTLIYVLVDSVAQYGALSEKAGGFGGLLWIWLRYYAAQVPLIFCRVLGPVTLAASAAFTVTLIQRANEFTPVMAAGVSLRRLLAPVLILAVLASLGAAAVQEIWIPLRRDEIREAKALGRGRRYVAHAKHFDALRRTLVDFRRWYSKELHGEGVLIYSPGGGPRPGFVLEARKARWVQEGGRPGRWFIDEGFVQEYNAKGEPIPQKGPDGKPAGQRLIEGSQPLSDFVEIDMLPQDLEERESQEPYLWLGELWSKAERSPDSHRWRLRLLSRLADPIHGMILVLLGIPTVLARGTRNIFLSAIATVIVSALYFVAYAVSLNLGNRGTVPPGLAVGLAPVFFASLGVTLYAKMRT